MAARNDQPGRIVLSGPSLFVTGDVMRMTDAERQARYRARKTALGYTAVTLLVPRSAVPELQTVAEALRTDDRLQPGPLRNVRSGKLVSAKSVLARQGGQR